MGFCDDIIDGLSRVIAEGYEGKPGRLAKALDIPVNQITRMLKRERSPQVDTVGPWLDFVGAKLLFPGSFLGSLQAHQELGPLATKVREVEKTLRSSGVAELEILRAVRSMLDAEIEKAMRPGYRSGETHSSYGTAAVDKEEYGKR